MSADLITLNISALNKPFKIKDNEAVIDNNAEKLLAKLIWLEQEVKRAREIIDEKILEAVNDSQLKPKIIVGNDIKINIKDTGSKYRLEKNAGEEFIKITQIIRPNTRTIEEYIKNNKELPDGVYKAVRSQKVEIKRYE